MTDQAKPGPRVAPDESGDDEPIDRRRIALIMTGLTFGIFMASLDQTIIATAVRTIADDLDGLTLQAWVTTSYLVTTVVSTALYGKFSDLYGRKPMYVLSVSLFLLGSVLCAAAQSMWQLAVFRAVQGLGAGGLITIAFAVLADLLSPTESARYRSYFGAVFGVSAVAGPVLGGFFAGTSSLLSITGWRWAFLINVPIGVVAALMIGLLYPSVRQKRGSHPIDRAGIATLVLCLAPLLVAAQQGADWGWGSPATLTMFLLGAVGLVLFVLAELRAGDAALLPPMLFRHRDFSMNNAVNVIVSMGVFGVLGVLPLYLQLVRGLSPTEAGLMLLPQTLGIVLVGRFSGPHIARTGKVKGFLLVGVATMAIASVALSTLSPATPLWVPAAATAAMGIGIGLAWQVMMATIQRQAPRSHMGAATASFSFFREIGATAGASVFLSVLFGIASGRISAAFTDAVAADPAVRAALHDPQVLASPANRPLLDAVRGGTVDLNNTTFLAHADSRLVGPLLTGLADAMSTVFVVSGVILVAGVVLVVLTGKPNR